MNPDLPEVTEKTQDLNIAIDEYSIYERGVLQSVTSADLLGNEIAIRQLINELNLVKRANEKSSQAIQQLKTERAGYALQPSITGFAALVNLVGVFLVGLGTNYISDRNPPPGAWAIVLAGGILALASSVAAVFLPILISHFSKRVGNAD